MKIRHLPLLAAATSCLHAGEPVSPPPILAPAPEASDWQFIGAIYAPMMGLDGDIGIGPVSAPVDIPFKDILSDLDAGLMVAFEARRDRWSITGDFIWLRISNSSSPIPDTRVDFKEDEILASLALGYEVYGDGRTSVELLAGGALTSLDADLVFKDYSTNPTTRIKASGSECWVDPFIGLRVRHSISDKFGLFARFDYGGFGVSSDQYWQGLAGLSYNFTEKLTIALAYRTISVDYQSGDFSYDTETSGPNLGLVYRF